MQLKSILRPTVLPFLRVRARHLTQRRNIDFGARTSLHPHGAAAGKVRRAA